MEPGSVRALLVEDCEVVDCEPDGPFVPGAIVVTPSSDAEQLATFRRAGATGVVTVRPMASIDERARLVALALVAGADYCLVEPTPADFAAHIRALARRVWPP